jgi:SpoVK/Ycf46/Vps4 family AAA+-type ATPase
MEEMIGRTFKLPGMTYVELDPAADNTEALSKGVREAVEKAAREKVKEYILTDALKVSWDDIAGNEEAHNAMRQAIEQPVKHAALYAAYGKKPTKGILLYGPPGCGKTMFGKAAAQVVGELFDASATLLAIPATKIQKPYVGQTEQIIRDIFAYARAYKARYGHSLVVFIDEADAILPARLGNTRGIAGWEESNIATFLSEMDGLEDSGAVVILATNRPESIDQAVTRPGRIDYRIRVNRPDIAAARVILERELRGVPIFENPIMHEVPMANVPHLEQRNYVAENVVEELFNPLRHVFKVRTERGMDFMNLADCVSGAMIVGLIERAKAIAINRDLVSGIARGVMISDFMTAIDAITAEQVEHPDLYALRELAQRLKTPVLELDRVHSPEIKYTGTLQ